MRGSSFGAISGTGKTQWRVKMAPHLVVNRRFVGGAPLSGQPGVPEHAGEFTGAGMFLSWTARQLAFLFRWLHLCFTDAAIFDVRATG